MPAITAFEKMTEIEQRILDFLMDEKNGDLYEIVEAVNKKWIRKGKSLAVVEVSKAISQILKFRGARLYLIANRIVDVSSITAGQLRNVAWFFIQTN